MEVKHETAREHADRIEFDTLMDAVQKSDLPPVEKDALRELLIAGYRNLNGDPIEEKVKLLARVDWAQIKRALSDSKKLSKILAAVQEIKAKVEERPKGRNLCDLLAEAKTDIRYVLIVACVFPGGAALLSALKEILSNPAAGG